jgi:D-sedoheptulose 7-phosphate isomerase
VERLRADHVAADAPGPEGGPLGGLAESVRVKQRLLSDGGAAIARAGHLLADAVVAGHRVLLFGNGGSAAEAQHIAAELTGRFERDRRALPAVALTTDTSALTAVSNDYGFERVFARQVEALAGPGDAVVALSTSGRSPNVLAAVMAARERGCTVVGITGARGQPLAGLCDAAVLVPSTSTARVQEASLTIGHLWCAMIEARLEPAR